MCWFSCPHIFSKTQDAVTCQQTLTALEVQHGAIFLHTSPGPGLVGT